MFDAAALAGFRGIGAGILFWAWGIASSDAIRRPPQSFPGVAHKRQSYALPAGVGVAGGVCYLCCWAGWGCAVRPGRQYPVGVTRGVCGCGCRAGRGCAVRPKLLWPIGMVCNLHIGYHGAFAPPVLSAA